MSRLTQDGTAKPISRDQIPRRERAQGNIHYLCSADHEQVWQSYPVDPYSDDFTYVLYLHIQQYRYMCIICTMNAAVEPIHVMYVHSYHDPASAALLSSLVTMRTSAYNKSVPERPGNTMNPALIQEIQFFLRTGIPQKICKS